MRKVALLVAAWLALLATPAAWAHKGNPNYESSLRSATPHVEGLEVQILNRDDRLELRNETGKTVVIEGYNGEPYARLLPDGTVEVNEHSPATYLNKERSGEVDLPPEADENLPPVWDEVSGTGTFEWHDHRIHWMGENKPDQVTNEDERTKIFDWKVPLKVGNQPVELAGTLFWTPRPGGDGPPLGAILALVAVVVGGGLLVVVVRRRRGRPGAPKGGEAW
jgi:hypothetical protein